MRTIDIKLSNERLFNLLMGQRMQFCSTDHPPIVLMPENEKIPIDFNHWILIKQFLSLLENHEQREKAGNLIWSIENKYY